MVLTSLDVQDMASTDIDDITLFCPPELLLQLRKGIYAALAGLAVSKFDTSTGLQRVLQEPALDIEHETCNARLNVKVPRREGQDPAGSARR